MCILNAPKTNNNMLIVSGSQTSLSGLPHLLRQRQEHFQFKGMVRYVHAHRAVIASQTMPGYCAAHSRDSHCEAW